MTEIDIEAILSDPEASKQLPKELREFAERQAAKAKESEEENAKLRKAVREREVGDFLKDKGLPAEVADLVGESDPAEWYEKYGKFMATSGAGEGAPSAGGDDGGQKPDGEAAPAAPPAQPPAQGEGNGGTPVNPGAALTPEQLQQLAGITGQVPLGVPDSRPVGEQMAEATKGAKSTEDFLERLKQVPGAVS